MKAAHSLFFLLLTTLYFSLILITLTYAPNIIQLYIALLTIFTAMSWISIEK